MGAPHFRSHLFRTAARVFPGPQSTGRRPLCPEQDGPILRPRLVTLPGSRAIRDPPARPAVLIAAPSKPAGLPDGYSLQGTRTDRGPRAPRSSTAAALDRNFGQSWSQEWSISPKPGSTRRRRVRATAMNPRNGKTKADASRHSLVVADRAHRRLADGGLAVARSRHRPRAGGRAAHLPAAARAGHRVHDLVHRDGQPVSFGQAGIFGTLGTVSLGMLLWYLSGLRESEGRGRGYRDQVPI